MLMKMQYLQNVIKRVMPENLSWFVKDRNFSGATEELQSLDSLSDCNFSLSRT